jgi:hypothetical protein
MTGADAMRAIGVLVVALVMGCVPATGQDIAGVEDCTKTKGLDRRTGCMQSNINFLQRTIIRNELEAHRRLQAAEREITTLRAAVAALRMQLDALAAAQKAGEKKVDDKSKGDGKKNGGKTK